LAPDQVPVQMKIVADLPRTSLLKVSEPELRALFLEEKQQGDA
jgi:acyl-coenzyme A synthetase/AMP-(fatty) acid ligase